MKKQEHNFVRDTVKKTGQSRSSVYAELQLADHMDKWDVSLKAVVEMNGYSFTGKSLLILDKLSHEKQLEIAKIITQDMKNNILIDKKYINNLLKPYEIKKPDNIEVCELPEGKYAINWTKREIYKIESGGI